MRKAKSSRRGCTITYWTEREIRIVAVFARRLANGRYESAAAAVRACADELARSGFRRRRTLDAISDKLESRAHGFGWPRTRWPWSEAEKRVLDRFACRVAAGDYRNAMAAAKNCRTALRQLSPRRRRTLDTVGARLSERAHTFGRRMIRVLWTAGELRRLDALARAVTAGRLRGPRQAALMFVQDASRRRAEDPRSAPPRRTAEATERKLWERARRFGLDWGFYEWSAEELGIADRYVRRTLGRRYRSLRQAGPDCLRALQAAAAQRARSTGNPRPFRRSLNAVLIKLRQLGHKRAPKRLKGRRWDGTELALAAEHAALLRADAPWPDLRPAARRLRRRLALRGYRRTQAACHAQVRRILARLAVGASSLSR